MNFFYTNQLANPSKWSHVSLCSMSAIGLNVMTMLHLRHCNIFVYRTDLCRRLSAKTFYSWTWCWSAAFRWSSKTSRQWQCRSCCRTSAARQVSGLDLRSCFSSRLSTSPSVCVESVTLPNESRFTHIWRNEQCYCTRRSLALVVKCLCEP